MAQWVPVSSATARTRGWVADRSGRERAARHAQPRGDENGGRETLVEQHRVEVRRAGDAGDHREDGDRDEAGGPRHVLVDGGSDPACSGGAAASTVEVSGATL